jgi:hypothetical protein
LDEKTDDKTEKAKDRTEDLDNKDLDKSGVGISDMVQANVIWEPYRPGSAASARAALLPLMPTDTPQMRLHAPTVNPAQNRA